MTGNEATYGLPRETLEKVVAVLGRYPEIKKVVLYGSRAKGNFRPGSDVDLVLNGKQLNLKLLNRIRVEIDDLLLPYTFDLSIFHQISNPDLIAHIERVGKIIHSRSEHHPSDPPADNSHT